MNLVSRQTGGSIAQLRATWGSGWSQHLKIAWVLHQLCSRCVVKFKSKSIYPFYNGQQNQTRFSCQFRFLKQGIWHLSVMSYIFQKSSRALICYWVCWWVRLLCSRVISLRLFPLPGGPTTVALQTFLSLSPPPPPHTLSSWWPLVCCFSDAALTSDCGLFITSVYAPLSLLSALHPIDWRAGQWNPCSPAGQTSILHSVITLATWPDPSLLAWPVAPLY